MSTGLSKFNGISTLIIVLTVVTACAQKTIKITIPRHSSLSEVQRLNRDGVRAVERHDYQKAAALFYKAYLFDPADPFTLNNLAFISEAQGHLDQAIDFYKLAAEQSCNASIDMSNEQHLEGQPMQAALTGDRGTPMRVAEINVEAVQLLSQGRSVEAAAVLEQALSIAPHDPFTLNNLGVAKEAMGDNHSALSAYREAADSRSQEAVAVTKDRSWRDKPISEIAQDNALRLDKQVQSESLESQAYGLTWRGVMAVNQNDWTTAQRDFMQAYNLDPTNAFSLNNRGFVAEKEGDPESAQFFYDKAQKADGAHAQVALATNAEVQGEALSDVAANSSLKVGGVLETYSQEQHEAGGNVGLTPRGPASRGGSPPEMMPPASPSSGPDLQQNPKPQNH